jgi:hypothetical protein
MTNTGPITKNGIHPITSKYVHPKGTPGAADKGSHLPASAPHLQEKKTSQPKKLNFAENPKKLSGHPETMTESPTAGDQPKGGVAAKLYGKRLGLRGRAMD